MSRLAEKYLRREETHLPPLLKPLNESSAAGTFCHSRASPGGHDTSAPTETHIRIRPAV